MHMHVFTVYLLEKMMSNLTLSNLKLSLLATTALLLAGNTSSNAKETGDAQAQAQAVVLNTQMAATNPHLKMLLNHQLFASFGSDAQELARHVLIGNASKNVARQAAMNRTHLASMQLLDAQNMAGRLLVGRAPN